MSQLGLLYRCNPRVELENLAAIVDRPPPKHKPDREVRQGFDPGRFTVSYNFSSGLSLSDIRPAFEFLRLFEEGGIPIRCGIFNVFGDGVVSSAKWILSSAPLWALSSMVRTNSKKKIEEQFDRVFVATLSQDNVNHLSSIFLTALTQTWQNLSGNGQRHNLDKNVLHSQVELLSELLSRLCFRLSSTQGEQVFSIGLNICRSYRLLYPLSDFAKTLLNRILNTMSQEKILEKIPELLLVDISIERELTNNQTQNIVEPFGYIKWEENTHLPQEFDRSTWSLPIKTLIELVRSGSPLVRGHAAFRLSKLCEIDGLRLEEKELFANALWSRVAPDTGLPSETIFFKSTFLHLPELEVGQAKAKFRQYLLSQEFPSVLLSSSMPNSSQGLSINPEAILYIQEWLGGTISLFVHNCESEQKLCDWTSDDVQILIRKIINSWNNQKEEIERIFLRNDLLGDELKKYFFQMKQLIAKVILPRSVDSEDEVKSSIKNFISDLETLGVLTLSLLPTALFIDPKNYDTVAQKLRFTLNSTEQDNIADSIDGLYLWFFYSARGSIPAPPNDLLNELVNRVLIRRQPGLDSVMQCLAAILKDLPQLFTDTQLEKENMCIALQYLLQDTELPNQLERDTLERGNMVIAVNARPKYRELAAEIAYRLHQLYTQTPEKAMPDILTKWREICQNDPLPEVRKVWK
jgi:hypothetical protein